MINSIHVQMLVSQYISWRKSYKTSLMPLKSDKCVVFVTGTNEQKSTCLPLALAKVTKSMPNVVLIK